MKLSLLLLGLIFTCALPAQQQNTVQEIDSESRYLFRVVLEAGSSRELMHCMNNVTTNNINIKMKGDLTTNIDEHSTLRIVTRDRVLTVEHDGNDVAERERTKAVVAQLKQCLNIQDTEQKI